MSVQRSTYITLFVLLAIVLAAAVAMYLVKQSQVKEAVMTSPAGSALTIKEDQKPYTDLAGNQVALADYLGEVLVVNSWASWCPSCNADLQQLATINTDYAEKGVRVFAINRAENTNTAQRYLQTVVGLDSVTLILDPDDNFYASIKGYTMPETVIFNPKGEIVFQKHGNITYDELVSALTQAGITQP